jgi:hypothetical protein
MCLLLRFGLSYYFLLLTVRWDILLENVDKKSLAGLVAVPTIKDPLYSLISCGRRYIKRCCQKLSGGNMIVRRSLMCSDTRYATSWFNLTCRRSFFDALQEDSSQRDYGTVLGQLVCFYVHLIQLQEEDEADPRVQWFETHGLKEEQVRVLQDIATMVNSSELDTDESDLSDLDHLFHYVLMELFCWTESRSLLEEIHCPVQRFLMVACLRKEGTGFISVRSIPPLIARLMYCIRATVYMELLKREGNEMDLERDLDGLQVYVKSLVQSPFGFLSETYHLASYMAGEASALPQITWIGKEFKSLAIHGKQVDLEEIRDLAASVKQDVKRKFEFEVKKGLSGLKNWNWKKFEPDDDLNKGDLNYSFVDKPFEKQRMALLDQFMENNISDKYFIRGRVGNSILWNKENCIAWLKQCKSFLECLAVSCHLEGGQPARGREFTTIRWKNAVDELRGVMWAGGKVVLLARYSKVRSQVSHDRLIPRYKFLSVCMLTSIDSCHQICLCY